MTKVACHREGKAKTMTSLTFFPVQGAFKGRGGCTEPLYTQLHGKKSTGSKLYTGN